MQTSNNDTYMRKNKINKLTVLKSGLNFEMSDNTKYISVDTLSYKHLAIQGNEQWEYIYPRIVFNINDIEDKVFNGKLNIENRFDFNKDLDNSYTTLAASQINWHKNYIEQRGLIFENSAKFRVVSISIDSKNSDDTSNIRFYPQLESNIRYPLIKSSKGYNQTLTPMIMPIIAPYNNYTEAQSISNSNLFSSNRAISIKEWESGPRINYGVEWFIDNNDNMSLKLTAGQSFRLN